jgi:hypothetical protein
MSQTAYTHTLTIACPEALMNAGNHLAVAIGEAAGDFHTFDAVNFQDAQGNRYCVRSPSVTDKLFEYAGAMLQRRDFAPEEWDFNLATQAQFAITLWFGPTKQQPQIPQANPQQLVGVVGINNPFQAIAAMGLTAIVEKEPV